MDFKPIKKARPKPPPQIDKECELVKHGGDRDCSYMYDCCRCGNVGCGCCYCFSCNACDHCKEES